MDVRHRALSRTAAAVFRVVWKIVFVLVATLVLLFALGRVIEALDPKPGSGTETVTAEEIR